MTDDAMTKTPESSATDQARGLWFVSPGEVELRSETLRSPEPEEVRVRAITSLVSAGTEMNFYRGVAGSPDGANLPTTRGTYPFPLKFGYQVVGEVTEAGENSGFSVGERVFAYHPHQEEFVMMGASSGMIYSVPDEVSSEQAAFANLYSVGYNGLLDTPVRIGDVVVVSGLGVIGTFVAHMCRETASRLVLIDALPERRERASWIRADAVVSPENAQAVIAELSNGRGSDLWFEVSGAPAALQTAIDNTGQEGTITVLSYYGMKTVPLILGDKFHTGRQRIVSSMVGAVGSGLQPRWDWARRYENAIRRLRRIEVENLVSHRIPFSNASEAYRMIDQSPSETLAVLLDYSKQ